MKIAKFCMCDSLISVIVPVYNVEQFIDRCISSIVNQTYGNLEIILVDDGSTDCSSELCDKWGIKDKRIKVIHKENGGLSSARNAGIAIAQGEYIGFVDSDDWIAEDMYEVLLNLLVSGNYDISSCMFLRTTDDEYKNLEKEQNIREYTQKEFVKELLKVGTQDSNQYAWNKLYRRNVLVEHQYPVGLTDEDVLGTLRAVLKSEKKIICTDRELYFYRINENSITAPIFEEKKWDFLMICDDICGEIDRLGDKEMQYWAQMFRARADFAILSRLLVMNIDIEYYKKCCAKKRELISTLRENYWKLLFFDWPMTRKVVMSLYCINYNLVRYIVRLWLRME